MMSVANNAAKRPPRLRVGLVADAEHIPLLAPALQRPGVELVGQSGMRQADALGGVPWQDDVRVMLAQSGLEALLVASSAQAGVEIARNAMLSGLHVWRVPPLGRSFAEAVETVTIARQAGRVHHVCDWWPHVAGDVAWAEALQPGFKPQYSVLSLASAGPSVQSPRASLVDTGGGVLTTDAYWLIEALLATRGLPETIAATIGKCRRRPGEAPRETEDVATAVLRYEGGGVALIAATWDIPPYGASLALHGADASVYIEEKRVVVRLADFSMLDERAIVSPVDVFDAELTHFENTIRAGGTDSAADAMMDRHLAISALLEAVYLSARTGQPESPRKFYQVQGWPEPAG